MPLLGLAADVISANVDRRNLPYTVTLVATYHCNFRALAQAMTAAPGGPSSTIQIERASR